MQVTSAASLLRRLDKCLDARTSCVGSGRCVASGARKGCRTGILMAEYQRSISASALSQQIIDKRQSFTQSRHVGPVRAHEDHATGVRMRGPDLILCHHPITVLQEVTTPPRFHYTSPAQGEESEEAETG